jgi:hypothetical protein
MMCRARGQDTGPARSFSQPTKAVMTMCTEQRAEGGTA